MRMFDLKNLLTGFVGRRSEKKCNHNKHIQPAKKSYDYENIFSSRHVDQIVLFYFFQFVFRCFFFSVFGLRASCCYWHRED